MKRLREGLVVLAVALAGCTGSTVNAPFAHNAFTAGEAPPRLTLYSIGWWHGLVPPQLMEYEPREPARPGISPDGKVVVVGTRDGAVHAFGTDGVELWKFKTPNAFLAGPLVTDTAVYVPGGDGLLTALDRSNGKELWHYDASEALATVPVLADGKLLVASAGNTLFAVDQASGKWLWQYRRDLPDGFTVEGVSTPVVRQGTIFEGFADGHLVALELSTGAVKWDKALSSASQFIDVDAGPAFDDQGRLIAASYSDGLYALDPESGTITWRKEKPGISHLTVQGSVAFATGENGVSAFATATGNELWNIPLPDRPGLQPTFTHGLLLVPDREEMLFINPAIGRVVLPFDPGKGVSAPAAVVGSRVYVLSNLGYLYAMDLVGRAG